MTLKSRSESLPLAELFNAEQVKDVFANQTPMIRNINRVNPLFLKVSDPTVNRLGTERQVVFRSCINQKSASMLP